MDHLNHNFTLLRSRTADDLCGMNTKETGLHLNLYVQITDLKTYDSNSKS